MTITAFTGHRPPKLGGYQFPNPKYTWVRDRIREQLEQIKPDKAISGMAQGVDQWGAEICIELGIPFIAACPFDGFDKKWPEDSKKRTSAILEKADEIIVVSPGGYSNIKFQIRDEWMVDNADNLIAVFDGSKSGTKNTIDYAKTKDKLIYYVDPNEFESP